MRSSHEAILTRPRTNPNSVHGHTMLRRIAEREATSTCPRASAKTYPSGRNARRLMHEIIHAGQKTNPYSVDRGQKPPPTDREEMPRQITGGKVQKTALLSVMSYARHARRSTPDRELSRKACKSAKTPLIPNAKDESHVQSLESMCKTLSLFRAIDTS